MSVALRATVGDHRHRCGAPCARAATPRRALTQYSVTCPSWPQLRASGTDDRDSQDCARERLRANW